MYGWNFYKSLAVGNRVWLKRIGVWAALSVLVGFLTYIVQPEILPKLQSFLDEVFRDVLGQEELRLDFQTAYLIFRNNLTIAVLILFLGLLFGLLPLFSVAVNFFVLGFLLASFVVQQKLAGLGLFLAAVLPHGIFEIPALLIAAAFGLRFGWSWRWADFKTALRQNFQVLPFLAALLFLAAVIEVYVTGNLVEWLLKQ